MTDNIMPAVWKGIGQLLIEHGMLRSAPPHRGQQLVIDSTAKFRTAACGREFGKTWLAEYLASHVDRTKQSALIVHSQVIVNYKYVRMEKLLDMNRVRFSKRFGYIFDFPEGGQLRLIDGHHPSKLLGYRLEMLIIDDSENIENDTYNRTIRPAMMDNCEGVFIGTPPVEWPWPGRHWFHKCYQQGFDPLEQDWVSFRLPTVVNPMITMERLQKIEREIGVYRYMQMYEAMFLDDEKEALKLHAMMRSASGGNANV